MDSALKQRLLGAAVLIALAIIFVPMFLGSAPPKQDNTTRNLDIPPPPERKFETRTLTVDSPAKATASSATNADTVPAGDKIVTVDTRSQSTPAAAENATPPTKAVAPASVASVSKPVAPPPPVVAETKAPAASANDELAGRFVVNLGIYADQAHANALVAKLKKLGFAAFSEATEYQGKTAQRVRVGPFAERAGAESARLKIKQAEPKVPSSIAVSVEQPRADVPATAIAANRAGGWAVQLGAFKSEAEANKLRDRVRNAGVAAFVDRNGSGEQTLWRVRAGPFADRAGAESTRASIKQKLQTDGIIVTQP